MRKVFRAFTLLLVGMALGAGATFAAFRYHAVRAGDGWHVVPSGAGCPADCVADVRNWTPEEWARHPALAAALAEAGEEEVVLRSAASGLFDRVRPRR